MSLVLSEIKLLRFLSVIMCFLFRYVLILIGVVRFWVRLFESVVEIVRLFLVLMLVGCLCIVLMESLMGEEIVRLCLVEVIILLFVSVEIIMVNLLLIL